MADNTLASAGVEFFGDLTRLERDMQKAEGDAVRAGNRIGERAGKALGEKAGQEAARHTADNYRREIAQALGNGTGLLPTGAAFGSLMGGGGTAAIGGSLISGATQALFYSSNQAAQMQAYREQLTGIARDASVAGKALEELKGIAAATNYNTDEVVSLGVRMAGKDGNVASLPAHVQAQLDTATAFGVQTPDFEEYARNLSDLTNRGSNRVERVDMEQLKRRAPLVTTAVANAYGISTPEADKKLNNLTGDDFKVLLERVAAANNGLSNRMGGTTPQRMGNQISDDISQGAADTGQLVNTALLPMFRAIHDGTSILRTFNQVTGGAAGLVGILGAAVIGVKLVKAGTEQATSSIATLTGALRGLSVAAEGAATSTQVATVAEERKQSVERVTSLTPGAVFDHGSGQYIIPTSIFAASQAARMAAKGNPSGSVFSLAPDGVTTLSRNPVAEGDGFAGLITPRPSKLRMVGKGVGIALPFALSVGGDLVAGDGSNAGRARIGRDLSAIGTYGGLGGTIGSFFGPVGMGLGTGIGSAVGLGISEIQQYQERQNTTQNKSETAKNTEALQKNTDAVKDQTAKSVGGGRRINWAGTQAMREWAAFGYGMPNAMAAGIG